MDRSSLLVPDPYPVGLKHSGSGSWWSFLIRIRVDSNVSGSGSGWIQTFLDQDPKTQPCLLPHVYFIDTISKLLSLWNVHMKGFLAQIEYKKTVLEKIKILQ